jgi:hypothetical protein
MVMMTMIRNRHSWLLRTIATGVVCLFLVNQLAWAYPDRSALAPSVGLQEAYEAMLDELQEESDSDDHDLSMTEGEGAAQPTAAQLLATVTADDSIMERFYGDLWEETGPHVMRVARMALLLARRRGLSAERQLSIVQAALLHDVGTARRVPMEIWRLNVAPKYQCLRPLGEFRDDRDAFYTKYQCGALDALIARHGDAIDNVPEEELVAIVHVVTAEYVWRACGGRVEALEGVAADKEGLTDVLDKLEHHQELCAEVAGNFSNEDLALVGLDRESVGEVLPLIGYHVRPNEAPTDVDAETREDLHILVAADLIESSSNKTREEYYLAFGVIDGSLTIQNTLELLTRRNRQGEISDEIFAAARGLILEEDSAMMAVIAEAREMRPAELTQEIARLEDDGDDHDLAMTEGEGEKQPRGPGGKFGEKPGGSAEDIVLEAYRRLPHDYRWTTRELREASTLLQNVTIGTNRSDVRRACQRGWLEGPLKEDRYRLTHEGWEYAFRHRLSQASPEAAPVPAELDRVLQRFSDVLLDTYRNERFSQEPERIAREELVPLVEEHFYALAQDDTYRLRFAQLIWSENRSRSDPIRDTGSAIVQFTYNYGSQRGLIRLAELIEMILYLRPVAGATAIADEPLALPAPSSETTALAKRDEEEAPAPITIEGLMEALDREKARRPGEETGREGLSFEEWVKNRPQGVVMAEPDQIFGHLPVTGQEYTVSPDTPFVTAFLGRQLLLEATNVVFGLDETVDRPLGFCHAVLDSASQRLPYEIVVSLGEKADDIQVTVGGSRLAVARGDFSGYSVGHIHPYANPEAVVKEVVDNWDRFGDERPRLLHSLGLLPTKGDLLTMIAERMTFLRYSDSGRLPEVLWRTRIYSPVGVVEVVINLAELRKRERLLRDTLILHHIAQALEVVPFLCSPQDVADVGIKIAVSPRPDFYPALKPLLADAGVRCERSFARRKSFSREQVQKALHGEEEIAEIGIRAYIRKYDSRQQRMLVMRLMSDAFHAEQWPETAARIKAHYKAGEINHIDILRILGLAKLPEGRDSIVDLLLAKAARLACHPSMYWMYKFRRRPSDVMSQLFHTYPYQPAEMVASAYEQGVVSIDEVSAIVVRSLEDAINERIQDGGNRPVHFRDELGEFLGGVRELEARLPEQDGQRLRDDIDERFGDFIDAVSVHVAGRALLPYADSAEDLEALRRQIAAEPQPPQIAQEPKQPRGPGPRETGAATVAGLPLRDEPIPIGNPPDVHQPILDTAIASYHDPRQTDRSARVFRRGEPYCKDEFEHIDQFFETNNGLSLLAKVFEDLVNPSPEKSHIGKHPDGYVPQINILCRGRQPICSIPVELLGPEKRDELIQAGHLKPEDKALHIWGHASDRGLSIAQALTPGPQLRDSERIARLIIFELLRYMNVDADATNQVYAVLRDQGFGTELAPALVATINEGIAKAMQPEGDTPKRQGNLLTALEERATQEGQIVVSSLPGPERATEEMELACQALVKNNYGTGSKTGLLDLYAFGVQPQGGFRANVAGTQLMCLKVAVSALPSMNNLFDEVEGLEGSQCDEAYMLSIKDDKGNMVGHGLLAHHPKQPHRLFFRCSIHGSHTFHVDNFLGQGHGERALALIGAAARSNKLFSQEISELQYLAAAQDFHPADKFYTPRPHHTNMIGFLQHTGFTEEAGSDVPREQKFVLPIATRQIAMAEGKKPEISVRLISADKEVVYPEMEQVEAAAFHHPGDRPWNRHDFEEVYSETRGEGALYPILATRKEEQPGAAPTDRPVGYALLQLGEKTATVHRLQIDQSEDYAVVLKKIMDQVRSTAVSHVGCSDIVVLVHEDDMTVKGSLGKLLQSMYKFKAKGEVLRDRYQHAGESADAFQLVLWIDGWPMEIEGDHYIAGFEDYPPAKKIFMFPFIQIDPNLPQHRRALQKIERLVEPGVGEDRWDDLEPFQYRPIHVALADRQGNLIGYVIFQVEMTSGFAVDTAEAQIIRFRLHPDYTNSDAAVMLMNEAVRFAAEQIRANRLYAFVNEAEAEVGETSDWQLLLEGTDFEREGEDTEQLPGIGTSNYHRWVRRFGDEDSSPQALGREITLSTADATSFDKPLHLGNPQEIHDELDNRLKPYFAEDNVWSPAKKLRRGSLTLPTEADLLDDFLRKNKLQPLITIYDDLLNDKTVKDFIEHSLDRVPRINIIPTNGEPLYKVRVGDLEDREYVARLKAANPELTDDDVISIWGHASDWGIHIADSDDREENARRILFELLRYMAVDNELIERVNRTIRSNRDIRFAVLDEELAMAINTHLVQFRKFRAPAEGYEGPQKPRPFKLLETLDEREVAMAEGETQPSADRLVQLLREKDYLQVSTIVGHANLAPLFRETINKLNTELSAGECRNILRSIIEHSDNPYLKAHAIDALICRFKETTESATPSKEEIVPLLTLIRTLQLTIMGSKNRLLVVRATEAYLLSVGYLLVQTYGPTAVEREDAELRDDMSRTIQRSLGWLDSAFKFTEVDADKGELFREAFENLVKRNIFDKPIFEVLLEITRVWLDSTPSVIVVISELLGGLDGRGDIPPGREPHDGSPATAFMRLTSEYQPVSDIKPDGVTDSTTERDLLILVQAEVVEREGIARRARDDRYRIAPQQEEGREKFIGAYLNYLFSEPRGNVQKYTRGEGRRALVKALDENFMYTRIIVDWRGEVVSPYRDDAQTTFDLTAHIAPGTEYTISINMEKLAAASSPEEARKIKEALERKIAYLLRRKRGIKIMVKESDEATDPTYTFTCTKMGEKIGETKIDLQAHQTSIDKTVAILNLGLAASAVPDDLEELKKKLKEKDAYVLQLIQFVNQQFKSLDLVKSDLIKPQATARRITEILHKNPITVVLPPVEKPENLKRDFELDLQAEALYAKFA